MCNKESGIMVQGAEKEKTSSVIPSPEPQPLAPTTPSLWVLLDDRNGNNHQSLGLAAALNIPKELIQIKYNSLAKLPNALRQATMIGVDNNYTPSLEPPFPDMVIAAGRKLAPIALYIKRQNPNCKLYHIMHPNVSLEEFEAIILPEHDRCNNAKNIIRSLGALNHISKDKIITATQQWSPHLAHIPSPRTALMIGGNTKSGKMHPNHIKHIIETIRPIIAKENGGLLISTSRRTPNNCVATLKEEIKDIPHQLYDYNSGGANPYLGFISLAERIIITGESVSMISEAAFTTKPLYIAEIPEAMNKKHLEYCHKLYELEYAKPLTAYSPNWRKEKCLNEAKRIAKIIINDSLDTKPT